MESVAQSAGKRIWSDFGCHERWRASPRLPRAFSLVSVAAGLEGDTSNEARVALGTSPARLIVFGRCVTPAC